MKSVRIRNMKNISMIQTLKTFDIVFFTKAPEGESYEDVYQRVEHFMNHVVNEDTQKMISSLLHIKLSFVV